MDYFIPIVGGDSLEIFREVCREFNYVLLPYYDVYLNTEIIASLREINPDIKIILSSIMPDEYLKEEDTFNFFLKYAKEIDADYLLVWDTPTYLNDYNESWKYTRESLRYIERIGRIHCNVIPLIKGAYMDQISHSCNEIISMGYEIAAFHVSQYLSTKETPWPEIGEYGLSFQQYLMRILSTILEYDFKEILLVGGASPRFFSDFIKIDNRIRLAGYSWYIDAKKYRLYTDMGNIIDLRNKFYICSCPSCRIEHPPNLRDVENIAKHNILLNKSLIYEEADMDYESEYIHIDLFDLILDTQNDLLILNDIVVGDEYSIWRGIKPLVEEYGPDHILFTGDLIYPNASYDELSEFANWIREISGMARIFYLSRYTNPKIYLLNILPTLYFQDNDFIEGRVKKSDPENTIELIIKFILTAKPVRMKIRKYTWGGYFDVDVYLPGPAEKTFEASREELKNFNREGDWLVTNYIPQPYIDKENKVATLGRWTRLCNTYERPEPGAVYIDKGGDVKLVKPEYR